MALRLCLYLACISRFLRSIFTPWGCMRRLERQLNLDTSRNCNLLMSAACLALPLQCFLPLASAVIGYAGMMSQMNEDPVLA